MSSQYDATKEVKKPKHFFRNSIILILAIFIYLFADSNLGFIKIHKYELSFENLPNSFQGMKILVLTDLHSREFGKDSKYLSKKIKKANPDMIVVTGDIINTWDSNADVFLTLVEQLERKYPIYYIYGNHEVANDYAFGSDSVFRHELESRGVIVLHNEKAEVFRNGEKIVLYGLTLPLWAYSAAKEENAPVFTSHEVAKRVGKLNPDEFNILLAHTPTKLEAYSEWGANLVLSGHMHGGMIQVPFLGGLLSPEIELFPKYDEGYFTMGKTKMVVSSGLGNGVFPIRFLNKPELCIVTLLKNK